MWRAVALTTFLAACVPNLGDGSVRCGTPNLCPAGTSCQPDGFCRPGPVDGGDVSDGAAPLDDGGFASGCMSARICSANLRRSAPCTSGKPVPDRLCPPDSTCQNGYCAVPSPMKSCGVSQTDCAVGFVCAPFVVGGALQYFCAQPMPNGTMPGGSSCSSAGRNERCTTGYCVGTQNGDNVCLAPCLGQQACMSGFDCVAVARPPLLEGTPTSTMMTCAPHTMKGGG
jgi:hypothetical protein